MTDTDQAAAPKWIYDEVIPAVNGRVRSLHLLKQKGSRKSVLLFADDATLVAEKGMMSGVKVYRVDYPRGLLLNESNCPHCGKLIQEPVGKIARLAGGKKAEEATPTFGRKTEPAEKHEPSEKQKDVLAYARDMKKIRERAKKQSGGKGPIKARAAAQKARKKHGLK